MIVQILLKMNRRTKVKHKYNIQFLTRLWTEIEVSASSTEEAIEKAKKIDQYSKLVTRQNKEISINDGNSEVIGFWDNTQLNKLNN